MRDKKIEGKIVFTATKCSSLPFDYRDEKDMWADVGTILSILLKDGYEVLVREEETNIIVLEYCYNPINDFGSPRFVAIDEEEEEQLNEHCED